MITEYFMQHSYWIWIFYISIFTFYAALGISWFFNTKLFKKYFLRTDDFLPWLLNGAMLGNIAIILPLVAFGPLQLFVESGMSGMFVVGVLVLMLLASKGLKVIANFRRKYILKEK